MSSAIELEVTKLCAGFIQHKFILKVQAWNNKQAKELLDYSLSKLPEAINKSKVT